MEKCTLVKSACQRPKSNRMPELPEVETIARCLAPEVTGRTITRARVLLPRTVRGDRAFAAKTEGRKIAAVHRRAKLLLLELTPPLVLAFHLKMTGAALAPANRGPARPPHPPRLRPWITARAFSSTTPAPSATVWP